MMTAKANVGTGDQAGGASRARARIAIRGLVQGVGFRPFAHRLAVSLELAGWVQNSAQGVLVEIEGAPERVRQFLLRIETEKPALARIQSLETTWLDPVGLAEFEIRASDAAGELSALVLPDIATCPECWREIFDPQNRRHRYPFTNCTHCGPRFSIIEKMPYDRLHTTMRRFTMCPECRAEYENPADRRFHAQPNACPKCGPRLEWRDAEGRPLARENQALLDAETAIRQGRIVAVKGLGGFHLVADARNDAALRELRRRKHREEKPFALFFPSVGQAGEVCEISPEETRLLRSPEAPIVLLRRRIGQTLLSEQVAPGNPFLGVMLPYTPLHHLLLADLGFPVVATSGNLSDEPICTDEAEAVERLRGIADFFLVHDRPIARHVDDSLARVMLSREMVLRRARGFAPLPVMLPVESSPVLAVGAHLKNTVALAKGRQVFLSQHLGDLETAEARRAFTRATKDLQGLLAIPAAECACDLHPDYVSTREAHRTGLPVKAHQHHAAHVAACLAENALEGPALGVSWDGTGYGPDGTVWGGEFILMHRAEWHRVAWLRPFMLPGGEVAVHEPRRSAVGLLFALFGEALFERRDLSVLQAFRPEELRILRGMLQKRINCPLTTSAGRLFDAVAAICGLRQRTNFEGQSAMALEWEAEKAQALSFKFQVSSFKSQVSSLTLPVVDWGPLVEGILADLGSRLPIATIAFKFHQAMAEIVVAVARQVGENKVALTGGCFQNRLLTELTVPRLRAAGFTPYWHQRVPPNDGGIALGQAAMSAYMRKE